MRSSEGFLEARRDSSDGVEPLRPEALNKEKLNVEKEAAEILEIGDEENVDSEDEKIGVCGGEDVARMGAREDSRKLRGMGDPRKPTQKEVEEHRLTHLPYRNWCTVCVKAKGKDLDHRKVVTEDRGVSEYAFDYCFPGDEFGYKLTILAGRERLTGLNFATEGSSGSLAVDKALDFIEEPRDINEKVIVKNDQEVTIQYFIKDLACAAAT